jgi:hypothetical protein
MTIRSSLFITALLLVGGSAAALTLEEQQSVDGWNKQLQEKLAATNQTCGSRLNASYDLKSEADLPASRKPGNGNSYCMNALDGIAWVCRNERGKAIIAKGLTMLTCRYESGSSKRTKRTGPELHFKKGTLSMTFDWNTGNVEDEVGNYLSREWDPSK